MVVRIARFLCYVVLTTFLYACPKIAKHCDADLPVMISPIIWIHGEFGFITGAYDITVFSDGHVTYSNYPLSAMRLEFSLDEVANILCEMYNAGFWSIDQETLNNAFSGIIIQDATKITIKALWQGNEKILSFERDRLFSPLVNESSDVTSLRRCVDLIERKVLASHLP